ncbi:MAG: hypothetical protein MPJ24_04610 [Pirellulaceae bacterium]|nr:hypothetical protein [Pirellulaceae bacterium]
MAQQLFALEWDETEARLLVARKSRNQLKVDDAFAIDLYSEESSSLVEVLRKRIPEELEKRNLKIQKAETFIALSRASVELRQLTLPPAPESELPDLVAFQAMREFSALGKDWSLDFIPIDQGNTSGEGTENSYALAAAISPVFLKQIHTICEDAGVTPNHVTLRPYAMANVLREQKLLEANCQLVVDIQSDEVDLTIFSKDQIVLMRTFRLPAGVETAIENQALLNEIRRTTASAQNLLDGYEVEKILLCGLPDEYADFKELLREVLSTEIGSVDPFANLQISTKLKKELPQPSGRFTSLIGMLVGDHKNRKATIDFLNPRKAPDQNLQQKKVGTALGLIAGCLLLIYGSFMGYQIWSYSSLASLRKATIDKNKKNLEEAEKTLAKIELMDRFSTGDISLLDEWDRIVDKIPSQEKVLINNLSFKTKDKKIGAEVTLGGYADHSKTVTMIEKQLSGEGYVVESKGATYVDDDNLIYPWRFNETIKIESTPLMPKKKKSTKKKKASKDSKKRENDKKKEEKEGSAQETDDNTER